MGKLISLGTTTGIYSPLSGGLSSKSDATGLNGASIGISKPKASQLGLLTICLPQNPLESLWLTALSTEAWSDRRFR